MMVYITLVIFERKKFPSLNDLTFFFVFSRRTKRCPAWTWTSQGRCGLCCLCCWRWRHPWLCYWSLAALYWKDPWVRTPYPDHPGWEQSGLSRIQVNNFQKVPFCLQFEQKIYNNHQKKNSPIHEFKVLHKSQRAFLKPLFKFLFITSKNILSLVFWF